MKNSNDIIGNGTRNIKKEWYVFLIRNKLCLRF